MSPHETQTGAGARTRNSDHQIDTEQYSTASHSYHSVTETSSDSQDIKPKATSSELCQRWSSHPSQGHDIAVPADSDGPDHIYDRFSPLRKKSIVAVLSFCSFLAPISSTTVLAAVPEVARDFGTTGTVINLSNALYLLAMGLAPCVWGPLSQVYGRRVISLISGCLFCICSIGTALAPDLEAFFVFRILTAFEGTSFLIVGTSCISDIYKKKERATGMAWFLSGTLVGPALGPLIGGVIVTFRSWRVIFWLQAALAAAATIAVYFLLPETIHKKKSEELIDLHGKPLQGIAKAKKLWTMVNPYRVIKLLRHRNLVFTGLASGSIVWNMYSLLSPIRYVLNPRFHLTSPIQSALFYLAPGAGYLIGSFFGGKYADRVAKKYEEKRNERVSEDRLRTCLPYLGGVIPVCMLIYGWSVEKAVGGIALPVLMMFIQGVAQLCYFPAVNTYSTEVMEANASEVVSLNYMIRYLFGAMGTAVVLPAIKHIGVGWFSTISAVFMIIATFGVYASVLWGKEWRSEIDASRMKREVKKREVEMEAIEMAEKHGAVVVTDQGVAASDMPGANV